MTKTILVLVLVACSFQVFSQKKEKQRQNIDEEIKRYNFSIQLKDYFSAGSSALSLYLSTSEDKWKDSLAQAYYYSERPEQVVQLFKMSEESASVFLKRTAAFSYLLIDSTERSYTLIQEVYDSTRSTRDLASLSWLQYLQNEKTACLTSIDKLQKIKEFEDLKVFFPVYSRQLVPLKAVVFYIQGELLKDLGKPQAAINMYDKALAAFPEFPEAAEAKSEIRIIKKE